MNKQLGFLLDKYLCFVPVWGSSKKWKRNICYKGFFHALALFCHQTGDKCFWWILETKVSHCLWPPTSLILSLLFSLKLFKLEAKNIFCLISIQLAIYSSIVISPFTNLHQFFLELIFFKIDKFLAKGFKIKGLGFPTSSSQDYKQLIFLKI